jgi:hypothetical protein
VFIGGGLFAYLLAGISAIVFGLLAGAPFGEGIGRSVVYALSGFLFWILFREFKWRFGRKLPVWNISCASCENLVALALSKTRVYFLEEVQVVAKQDIERSRRAFTLGVKILVVLLGLPLAIVMLIAILRALIGSK